MDQIIQQAANLNGSLLVSVLDRALRSPNIYYYSELLNLPNVQAVRILKKKIVEIIIVIFRYILNINFHFLL